MCRFPCLDSFLEEWRFGGEKIGYNERRGKKRTGTHNIRQCIFYEI